MSREYEVIVVGGGPAGATLAYELASKGIEVLVLEKAIFPRYKCCAGGLTIRVTKLLDSHFQEVVENSISGLVITFAGNRPYYGTSDQTIVYTVTREKFDHALLKRAMEAGATVLQGVKVLTIQADDTGVEVLTTAGKFRSKLLAGADGARSIAARALGVRNGERWMVALETEVSVADKELAEWNSRVAIDVGRLPMSYAWLFPKSDHLSLGIASAGPKVRDLKRHFGEFLSSFGFTHYTVSRWSGSVFPVCDGRSTVARGRVALLGDAAGLADPLTGEGIYNAVLSAKLAAPVMAKALLKGDFDLRDYSISVAEKILPEMRLAYMFSKVFERFPYRLFQLLKRDERIWHGCCQMLRGEISYSLIKDKISTFRGLYHLVSLALGRNWKNPGKQLRTFLT